MLRYAVFFFSLLFAFSTRADLIEKVYQTLEQDYINELSNKDITLKGLSVLNQIDPQIKLILIHDKFFLYQNKKLLSSFALPQTEESSQKWADLSREIINLAVKSSEKIELIDFELPDRFAENVFKGLDGYSQYVGEFSDDADQTRKVRRDFAVRQVGDILLIKIAVFSPEISAKVRQAVEECSACRGIILDLRGNHGGILNEAIKISDLFLDEGIITYTMAEDHGDVQFYTANSGDISGRKPIAILIDGYTASAAEVLSAALSEQNRAVLFGTSSYGKGTVQNVVKFGDERAMVLTATYFYTPSGSKIDKTGLKPAICTGNLHSVQDDLTEASCTRQNRFNDETDVEFAVKFLKNELTL